MNLVTVRKAAELTQKDIAAAMGCDQGSVSKMEARSDSNPRPKDYESQYHSMLSRVVLCHLVPDRPAALGGPSPPASAQIQIVPTGVG
jgi:Helix-turn-helix